ALAAKVLVTRVASGRVFSKVLTPYVVRPVSTAFVSCLSPAEARDLVESVRKRQLIAAVQDSVVLSIIFEELTARADQALPVQSSLQTATALAHSIMQHMRRVRRVSLEVSTGEGSDGVRAPPALSIPYAPPSPVPCLCKRGGCLDNVHYATPEEVAIVRGHDIQFYPIVVYAKLDIQGFTK
ncbi:hypothetical protein KIPB_015514, partial [Kipferlia bialata]